MPRRSSRLVETAAPAEEGGDLLKLLDDLEAKEALDVSDVTELYRALSLDSAGDASAESRAFALVDPAVQAGYAGAGVDAVALEACALTLALADSPGSAARAAERAGACCGLVRRAATAAAAPRDAGAPPPEPGALVKLEECFGWAGALARARALEDAAVASLCAAAFAALRVDAATDEAEGARRGALGVVGEVFGAYAGHRGALVEDWFDHAAAAGDAPRKRKGGSAAFRLDGGSAPGGARVAWASAWCLVAVQGAVGADDDAGGDPDAPPSAAAGDRVAARLARGLLERAGAAGEQGGDNANEWRSRALALCDDAAAALPSAEWPAAETVLRAVASAASAELRAKRPEGAVCFLVDVVARVAAALTALRRREAEAGASALPAGATFGGETGACALAGDAAPLEQTVALQQLVLNGLEERTSERWAAVARKFAVAKWFGELPADAEALRAHLAGQFAGRSALMMRRGDWDVVLPRDALAGCCVAVANRSRLGDARVQLTHQVAALLGHDGAAVRCRALKALDGVARERGGGDAPLLRDPVVRRAVLSRFLDEAISVRAAAVDLVGNHALDAPETLLAYHGELLERLLDAGVSVRKAVVRILEKSLAVRGEQLRELHKRTLLALLDRASRPKEEQTVKDLVGDVIRDAWFAERGADEEAAAPEKVSPSSVILEDVAQKELPPLDATTRQIVDVAAAARGNDGRVAEVLAAALAASRAAGSDAANAKRQKRAAVAAARASDHAAKLVERLLALDARRAEGLGASGSPGKPPRRGAALGAGDARDVVDCLRALRALARAAPGAVAGAAATLAPYLRADNGLEPRGEAEAVSLVAEILAAAAAASSRADCAALGRVASPDLRAVVLSLGTTPTSAALACLVALERRGCRAAAKALWRLAASFFGARRKTARAFVVLGALAEQWADGLAKGPPADVEEPSALAAAKEPLRALHRALVAALEDDGDAPRDAKIDAVCRAVSGRPPLASALARRGVLDAMLGVGPAAARSRALASWARVLDGACAAPDAPDAATDARALILAVEEGGDAAEDAFHAVAGATQGALPRVHAALADADGAVRVAALGLVGAVLRHGLCNPRDAVPRLLACLGDAAPRVRDRALQLLELEDERRPAFVAAALQGGVGAALARGASGDGGAVLASLGAAYATCARARPESRAQFLRGALKAVDVGAEAGAPAASRLRAAALGARLLATLPYRVADEPLSVVYALSKQVALAAPESERLAACATLSLAARAKRHLKRFYRLGDARCVEYVPGDRRLHDKGLPQRGAAPDLEIPRHFVADDADAAAFLDDAARALASEPSHDFDAKPERAQPKKRGRPPKADDAAMPPPPARRSKRATRPTAPLLDHRASPPDDDGDDGDWRAAKPKKKRKA